MALERLLIDSSMNVAGRKIVGVDRDPGEAGLQLVERRLDSSRHVQGVRPRQLLDDEHQPVAVVDDGIADQRLVVL